MLHSAEQLRERNIREQLAFRKQFISGGNI
jgi:hypothetical protein